MNDPFAPRRRPPRQEGATEFGNRDAASLVFEAADVATRLYTMAQLDFHFGPIFQSLGFDVFFGLRLVRSQTGLIRATLGGGLHEAWENHYAARRYLPVDPVVAEMVRSTEPGFWSELSSRRGDFTPEEHQVLLDAALFGMSEGFFFSLHHPRATVSGVVLAGAAIDTDDPDTRTAACILATAYDAASRRVHQEAELATMPASRLLKERQIECLRWVAAGKSSSEIATVLQLSRKTVDEHIDNACRAFGVNTRIQAVVRAMALNIIIP